MSPEMKLISNGLINELEFNPEKSDIFSLGISLLRLILLLNELYIFNLNEINLKFLIIIINYQNIN